MIDLYDMEEGLVRQALDHAGYGHVHSTEENIKQCFLDYVDSGIWRNLSIEDIDESITVEDMCKALLAL